MSRWVMHKYLAVVLDGELPAHGGDGEGGVVAECPVDRILLEPASGPAPAFFPHLARG